MAVFFQKTTIDDITSYCIGNQSDHHNQCGDFATAPSQIESVKQDDLREDFVTSSKVMPGNILHNAFQELGALI